MTKYAAQSRYDAANTVRVNLKLNRRTDADLIAALDAARAKQTLIKQALRAYLKEDKSMEKCYWTLEAWGDAYPPENADEIIAAANELIASYAESHDDEATERYSEQLWEHYCMTDHLQ